MRMLTFMRFSYIWEMPIIIVAQYILANCRVPPHQRLGHFSLFMGAIFDCISCPVVHCGKLLLLPPASHLILTWEWAPAGGRAGKQQASRITLSCKQTSPNLVKSGFIFFFFSKSLSSLPNSIDVAHSTAQPSSGVPISPLPLPFPRTGAEGAEMALSCVHHLIRAFLCQSRKARSKPAPGRGFVIRSSCCNRSHTQGHPRVTGGEQDPVTGSRWLAMGQGKELLTPPGSWAPMQSCPFNLYHRSIFIFLDISKDLSSVAQPFAVCAPFSK